MRFVSFIGLLVASLSISHCARGTEPDRHWWWPWRSPHPPCPCCPDDYCPKPMPLVPCPVHCAGPDDYCYKPLPSTCPVKCGGPDDYCRKPLPMPPSPCSPPWYTCGPAPTCAPPHRDGTPVEP
jgi:hypothetical protein